MNQLMLDRINNPKWERQRKGQIKIVKKIEKRTFDGDLTFSYSLYLKMFQI